MPPIYSTSGTEEYRRLMRLREEGLQRMMRQLALSTVVRSEVPMMSPGDAYGVAGPLLSSDPAEQERDSIMTVEPPRDWEELLGAADFHGIANPERIAPDELMGMLAERRQNWKAPEIWHTQEAMNALNLTSVSAVDAVLEAAQRIPFIGDALSRLNTVRGADRWLAELEEGLTVNMWEPKATVQKGVGSVLGYAVPATASWKLAGMAGALPGVATVGARVSPLGRAMFRGAAAEWAIEGGGDAPLAERALNIGLGAAFGVGGELGGVLGRSVTGAGLGAIAGSIASDGDPQAMMLGAAAGAAGLNGMEIFLRRAQRSWPTRSFGGLDPERRLITNSNQVDDIPEAEFIVLGSSPMPGPAAQATDPVMAQVLALTPLERNVGMKLLPPGPEEIAIAKRLNAGNYAVVAPGVLKIDTMPYELGEQQGPLNTSAIQETTFHGATRGYGAIDMSRAGELDGGDPENTFIVPGYYTTESADVAGGPGSWWGNAPHWADDPLMGHGIEHSEGYAAVRGHPILNEKRLEELRTRLTRIEARDPTVKEELERENDFISLLYDTDAYDWWDKWANWTRRDIKSLEESGDISPNVRPQRLNIQRVYDFDQPITSGEAQELIEAARRALPENVAAQLEWDMRRVMEAETPYDLGYFDSGLQRQGTNKEDLFKVATRNMRKSEFKQLLEEAGYDGVKHFGAGYGDGPHNVWIAFRPEQVYSAFGPAGSARVVGADLPAPTAGQAALSPVEARLEAASLTKHAAIVESPALAALSRTPTYDDADAAWAVVEAFPGQVGVVQNIDEATTLRRILMEQMPNGVGPQDFRVVKRQIGVAPTGVPEGSTPHGIIFDQSGFLESRTVDEFEGNDWHHSFTFSNEALGREKQGVIAYKVGTGPNAPIEVRVAPGANVSDDMIRAQLQRAGWEGRSTEIIEMSADPRGSDQIRKMEWETRDPNAIYRTDLLVSAGRPITNQMVKDYEKYGMFAGQRAIEGSTGLEVVIERLGPEESIVRSPGGGLESWVATADLMPMKASAIAEDVPGIYEDFRTFAQVRLDQQSAAAGIKALDFYGPEAAEQLPVLIDEFLGVYRTRDWPVVERGDSYYSAALRQIIEQQHIKALREFTPPAERAMLQAVEAEYRAVVAEKGLPPARVEDLAAARGMEATPQGKGFILVDRMESGLGVPVADEAAAREFLAGFQRELVDDAPASVYPLEMIETPAGYSETRGRVAGEWIDTRHKQDALESMMDDLGGGGGGGGGTPPPGMGGAEGGPPLLPPTTGEIHGAQHEKARRDNPRAYNQMLERAAGFVTDVFRDMRTLGIAMDNWAQSLGITEGRYYDFMSELENSHVRMLNRSSAWKEQVYDAIRPVRNRFLRDGTFWEALNADDQTAQAIMKNAGFRPEERQAVSEWHRIMGEFYDREASQVFPEMGRVRNYVSWMRKFEDSLPGEMRRNPNEPEWGAEMRRGKEAGADVEKDISTIIPRYFDGFFKYVEMDRPYRGLKNHMKDERVPEVFRRTLNNWADARMWGLDPTNDLLAKGILFSLNVLGKPFGLRFRMDDVMQLSYTGFAAGYGQALGLQIQPLIRDLPQSLIGGMQLGLDRTMPVLMRYMKDSAYRQQMIERAVQAGWVQRGHGQAIDADVFGGSSWKRPEVEAAFGETAVRRREQLAGAGDFVQDQVLGRMGTDVAGVIQWPLKAYGKLGDFARTWLGQAGYESAYSAMQAYVRDSDGVSGEALDVLKRRLLEDSRVARYQGAIQRKFLRMVDAGDYDGAATFFGHEVANSQNRYGMAAHPQAFRRAGPVTGRLFMRFGTFNSQTLAQNAQILSDPSISLANKAAYASQVTSLQLAFAAATAFTGWNMMKMSWEGLMSLPGTSGFELWNDIMWAQGQVQSLQSDDRFNPAVQAAKASATAGGNIPFVPEVRDFNPWGGAVRQVTGFQEASQWGPEAIGRWVVTGQKGDPYVDRMQQRGYGPPASAVPPAPDGRVGPYAAPFAPAGVPPLMPPQDQRQIPGGGAMY